ncbi:hypothetical protein ACHAXR_009122 [Thalassiosira sp. AJA248-18]
MHSISNSNNEQSSSRATRRDIIQSAINACCMFPSIASAENLPTNNGADLSRTGSIDTLIPVVAIRQSISTARLQLTDVTGGASSIVTPETCKILLRSLLESIPREEKAFKRIFDAYSTPVSYKQQFLDQNAFLVYYTKGFDGPGRPGIEDDATNNLQTLQYGSRNDAWTATDELFFELEFGQKLKGDDSALSSEGELVALFDKVLTTLDSYLFLSPLADVEEANRQLVK